MENLFNDFKESIFNEETKSVMTDYAEWGIDSILKDKRCEEIPILKTLLAFCRVATNIRECNLMKQTYNFIKDFNEHANTENVSRHREELNNNKNKLEEELERVLTLLDRNYEVSKTRLLALLYAAYVNRRISWDEFCEFSDIVNRMFVSDLSTLRDTFANDGVTDSSIMSHRHDRLISLGLLRNQQALGGQILMSIEGADRDVYIGITDIGRLFCEIIFN